MVALLPGSEREPTLQPGCRWLREGFELDGLTAPLNHIPPLYVPDDPDQELANRGEFAKLLEFAAVRAAEAGWRPNFDQHGADLYLKKNPDFWAKHVLFNGIGKPSKGRARQNGLRVWVVPRGGKESAALNRLLPVLVNRHLILTPFGHRKMPPLFMTVRFRVPGSARP